MHACDYSERDTPHSERKPRVSLGGQAAEVHSRDSATRSNKLRGILFASLRKWNVQRQPGDAAVWNGAKTGCAAKRSASSALEGRTYGRF